MAAGDVAKYPRNRTLKLLEAVTAANGVPSLSTHGYSLESVLLGCEASEAASILIRSTAGSGAMDVTVRIWGYHAAPAVWMPLGTHATATSKGVINEGNAMGEPTTDVLRHAEPILHYGHFDRLYCEVVSINGSSTAVSVWLDIPIGGA